MRETLGEIVERVGICNIEHCKDVGENITYETIINGQNHLLINDIMEDTAVAIDVRNAKYPEDKLPRPKGYTVQMVSMVLSECDDVALVKFNDSSEPNLAVRIRNPFSEYDSIWCLVETAKFAPHFDKLVTSLNPEADTKFIKEVKARLIIDLSSDNRKIRTALIDGIHVPCKNGVKNRLDGTFIEWNDSGFEDIYGEYAFTFKLKTNYNPNAANVVITQDKNGVQHPAWDFESHVQSLFDNNTPEICALYVKAFWEVAAHVLSGYSQGFGFFWCNSSGLSKGASGKSTLLAAFREIIGQTDVCNNSINSLTSDGYSFAQILGKIAILSDEMDESASIITGYDNIKKLLTMEPVSMREIYKSPVYFTPKMVFIQACNQVPKFKNPSESFFRRLRVLPFEKSFATDSGEASYIKNDYIKRQEILEYILRKCLEEIPIEYSADVLEATSAKKSIMKTSFPVFEFMDSLTQDYPIIADLEIIPVPLLYDMFSNWYERTNHIKTNISAQNFYKQLVSWVDGKSNWECVEGVHKIHKKSYHEKYDAVFTDYPSNTVSRIWTNTSDIFNRNLTYEPVVKTFRNGIRYTGELPRDTYRYLREVVLKDETGEWHEAYENYKNIYVANNICSIPYSFEEWAMRGCPNYYIKEIKLIERRELSDEEIPLVSLPIKVE